MLQNLLTARQAQGLSQARVAEMLGKSQAVYSKIERGKVQLSAQDALTLCQVFKIDLKSLLVTC